VVLYVSSVLGFISLGSHNADLVWYVALKTVLLKYKFRALVECESMNPKKDVNILSIVRIVSMDDE